MMLPSHVTSRSFRKSPTSGCHIAEILKAIGSPGLNYRGALDWHQVY